MLQKISVQQLRIGMYVDRLEGSWLDHPFWRGSFLVRHEEELQAIRESAVAALWIDPDRGLGLAEPAPPDAPARAPQLPAAAEAPLPPPAPVPSELRFELQRARRICEGSRPLLRTMFEHARMGRAIDTVGAGELVDEIADSMERNSWALLSVVRLKKADEYTYMHSAAVCALMIALARQLGLDAQQVRDAGMAGLLHDVGKAMIPPAIINKPGRLTPEEFEVMRKHPELGYELLRGLDGVQPAALDVCLHHHEKMDGSGYPNRAPGSRISLVARMAAVCDVYDAITSNRPYKQGWDPAGSLRRMAGWIGSHFDEAVFQHFVKSVGIYPVGSFVRLDSGWLGVVVDQSADSLLTPKVRVFLEAGTRRVHAARLVDLAQPRCSERIAGLENPSDWDVGPLGRYME